jgi:hypothetical protein
MYTYWDATLKDLQSHICPLPNRLQVDATIDKSLGKIAPPGAERVRPNCNRPRCLVRLEKFNGLAKYEYTPVI